MELIELGRLMVEAHHDRRRIGFVNGVRSAALALRIGDDFSADVLRMERSTDPYDEGFASGMRAALSEIER